MDMVRYTFCAGPSGPGVQQKETDRSEPETIGESSMPDGQKAVSRLERAEGPAVRSHARQGVVSQSSWIEG